MTLKTMNAAVSGLRAQEMAMGIVGDNIANINTVGFKRSRAAFEDVLGSVSARRTTGSGAGVRMARTQQIFSQGALQTTNVPTDLAISGEGFFVVEGTIDGMAGQFLTRNGQLGVRPDGALVTARGLQVLGYPVATAGGGFSSRLSPLKLTPSSLPPRATANAEVVANLDPRVSPIGTSFDINDPVATSNFQTSLTAYDPMGNPQTLDVHFVKTSNPNEWDVHVIGDAAALDAPTVAAPGDVNVELSSGTVNFDGYGQISSLSLPNANVTFDSVAAQTIAIDLNGLTQFSSPNSVSSQSQDGYPAGQQTSVDISPDGVVSGVYSNGRTFPIGQLALAKVQAKEELSRIGHNLWMATADSGQPAIGAASIGGRGAVISGAIEQSAVDLTHEFVSMITYQRAFSANAKTITTADEMLIEMSQLKR